MLVNGVRVEDPRLFKEAVFNHFQSFFKMEVVIRGTVQCENLVRVRPEDARSLEDVFTIEEVWETVRSCEGRKAPGPDGFNFVFFKNFWNLIKAGK